MDDQLDNVAGGITYRASMKPNTTSQTLPQMKPEDMPLNKLMNGGNAGQQPEGKIFIDGQTGQTLKSSDLKTYGALI